MRHSTGVMPQGQAANARRGPAVLECSGKAAAAPEAAKPKPEAFLSLACQRHAPGVA